MNQGYIHVYTGNGKGKTTAAIGLAVRAACSGKKVYIGQFVKDMAYSETCLSNYLTQVTIEQLGKGCFIETAPTEKDVEAAQSALEKCSRILKDGSHDVVILDEIFIAIHYQLVTAEQVLKALQKKAENVEVILTGRYAPDAIIDYADLVTEMREIKHYYQKGILSRKGIDC